MFRSSFSRSEPFVIVLALACTPEISRAQAAPDAELNAPLFPSTAAEILVAANPEDQRPEAASPEIPSSPPVTVPPVPPEPELPAPPAPLPLPRPVESPTGFNSRPFMVPPDKLLQGFEWGLEISSVYDSNLGRSSGLTPQNPEGTRDDGDGDGDDDFIFSVSPRMTWKSQGTRWSTSASAGLQYSEYLKNEDLSGLGYNARVALGYAGSSGRIGGTFDYALDRGGNRYHGSFIEEHRLGAGLDGSWKISPKTSLDGSLSLRWSEPSDVDTEADLNSASEFNTTVDYSARLSVMWEATPLLRLGPGISYTQTGGDNYAGREALGPTIRAEYQLAEKVALNGMLGLEYTLGQEDEAVSDGYVTTLLSLNYQANAFWSANASINRSVNANGAEADSYRETTSWRLGINRRILRAQLALGASYETGDVVSSSSTDSQDDALDSLILDVSLSMPLTKRIQGSLFASWRDESGYRSTGNGYQVGLSLSISF